MISASVGATAVAMSTSGCAGGDGGGSSRSAMTRAAKAVPRRAAVRQSRRYSVVTALGCVCAWWLAGARHKNNHNDVRLN